MYLDFTYIVLGYASSLTKRESVFDVKIPIVLGLLSIGYTLYFNSDIQLDFIKDVIPFIETLMGFTLAALAILMSNGSMIKQTKGFTTNRTIRGAKITMYELLVVLFSHLIIVETLLCVLYYIAFLFPFFSWELGHLIANSVFIIGVFHVLFTTIRTVANMYFIATGLK